VTDPDLILVDEPTGNLDAASAGEILELLAVLNNEHDKTMVMVTHDPRAARFAKTVRYLDKGVLRPPDHVPDKWSRDPMPIASKFKHTNSSQESHC
jgi:putative ABC transport system ATP-binding protein